MNNINSMITGVPCKEDAVRVLTLDHVVDKLNEIFTTDPDAMRALLNNRVECNQTMANHNSVQVMGTEDKPTVGILGILNGLIEPLVGGRIAVKLGEGMKVTEFIKYPLAAKLRININENDPIEI
jgi:hypothetical protein